MTLGVGPPTPLSLPAVIQHGPALTVPLRNPRSRSQTPDWGQQERGPSEATTILVNPDRSQSPDFLPTTSTVPHPSVPRSMTPQMPDSPMPPPQPTLEQIMQQHQYLATSDGTEYDTPVHTRRLRDMAFNADVNDCDIELIDWLKERANQLDYSPDPRSPLEEFVLLTELELALRRNESHHKLDKLFTRLKIIVNRSPLSSPQKAKLSPIREFGPPPPSPQEIPAPSNTALLSYRENF